MHLGRLVERKRNFRRLEDVLAEVFFLDRGAGMFALVLGRHLGRLLADDRLDQLQQELLAAGLDQRIDGLVDRLLRVLVRHHRLDPDDRIAQQHDQLVALDRVLDLDDRVGEQVDLLLRIGRQLDVRRRRVGVAHLQGRRRGVRTGRRRGTRPPRRARCQCHRGRQAERRSPRDSRSVVMAHVPGVPRRAISRKSGAPRNDPTGGVDAASGDTLPRNGSRLRCLSAQPGKALDQAGQCGEALRLRDRSGHVSSTAARWAGSKMRRSTLQ